MSERREHMKRILVCANCQKRSKSLTEDHHAWDGWVFYADAYGVERELCPECRGKLEEK